MYVIFFNWKETKFKGKLFTIFKKQFDYWKMEFF